MFKHSQTLDHKQKLQKLKLTEQLIELDKCLQIPYDDRQIIRRHLKQNNQEVIEFFQNFKKDKSYGELQLKLRKYIQLLKGKSPKNVDSARSSKHQFSSKRIYSQQSNPNSSNNSKKCSPERKEIERRVVVLDINQLRKKLQKTQKNKLSLANHQQSYEKGQLRTRLHSENLVQSQQNKSYVYQDNQFCKMDTCSSIQAIKIEHEQKKQELPTSPFQLNQKRYLNQKDNANKIKYKINENFNSYSQSLRGLLKSKLSATKIGQYKQKQSKPAQIQKTYQTNNQSNKNSNRFLIHIEQSNKQNINSQNLIHNPLFQKSLTERFQQRKLTNKTLKEDIQTVQYRNYPVFGQFHKRIQQIIKDDYY